MLIYIFINVVQSYIIKYHFNIINIINNNWKNEAKKERERETKAKCLFNNLFIKFNYLKK